jgi:chloramphenicol-sensitive protein RarD
MNQFHPNAILVTRHPALHNPPMRTGSGKPQQHGMAAIAAAFIFWGVVVIFWKQVAHVHSLELIAHRLLWGFLILLVTVSLRGTLPLVTGALRDPSLLRLHLVNAVLLTANWLAYVHAVTHNQILQGSLAYFMVPILNTLMGCIFLKEKLNRSQWIAISLATCGVANEILHFGKVPWLALLMAFTFAWYGMNKVRSTLGPLTSLTLETGLLAPLAVAGIVIFQLQESRTTDLTCASDLAWMFSTGAITVVPLLLFAYGARRIPLTTIGIFQFLAPSVKFGLGVFVYGEAFPVSKVFTFALIWCALGIYVASLVHRKMTTPLPT